MTFKNKTCFLEDIYNGAFDKEKFDSFELPEREEKTKEIINKYKEIIKEYNPVMLEEQEKIPDDLMEKFKKIGIFGLSIPKEYGGQGLSLTQYLLIIEEISKFDIALVITPIAHLSIGIKAILLFANEEQKKKYLTKAATGEMIFAYALTEAKHGSDAKNIECKAKLSEDGKYYILNGQKSYITNGNYAGGLTVFAQLPSDKPGFMGAFIVETDWDGVKVSKDIPKMGLKISSTTSIIFKNCKVPVENMIGAPGDGFKIAMSVLNYGRLGLGAASQGMLDQSFSDMMNRAASRIQFGKPINNFQLIQEKIVKAKLFSEASSAINYFTASLLEKNPGINVSIEGSHCKLYCTNQAWNILYEALQLAGGAGYLKTQPYEKRMRDFRVTTVFEGTSEIHTIYPPLFILRTIQKKFKKSSMIKNYLLMLKEMMKRQAWPLCFKNKKMQQASVCAKNGAILVRKLLYRGLKKYRRNIVNEEYYLRKITNLSIYIYIIISLLAKIQKMRDKKFDIKMELEALSYFSEKLEILRNEYKNASISKLECIQNSIIKKLL